MSVRSKIPLTRQNMSHENEHVGHWEGLEMWLSVTTDSILPKAAEALQHQTQNQLDDSIASIMDKTQVKNYPPHFDSQKMMEMMMKEFFQRKEEDKKWEKKGNPDSA